MTNPFLQWAELSPILARKASVVQEWDNLQRTRALSQSGGRATTAAAAATATSGPLGPGVSSGPPPVVPPALPSGGQGAVASGDQVGGAEVKRRLLHTRWVLEDMYICHTYTCSMNECMQYFGNGIFIVDGVCLYLAKLHDLMWIMNCVCVCVGGKKCILGMVGLSIFGQNAYLVIN